MRILSLTLPATLPASVLRLICLAALFTPWLFGQSQGEADIVLHNGKILTVDDSFSVAEAVDRVTALRMITRWAADYVLKGDKLGSIEPGKLADLVVLDSDYMTIPEEDISEIQPQITMLDGKVIFVHSNFAEEYNFRPSGALVTTYEELVAKRPAGSR